MTRPLVGIDLAPANLTGSAPGTARHVAEIGRALAKLEAPWDWLPTVEDARNSLKDCFPKQPALVVPGKSVAWRAWWSVGQAWSKAGCQLGFATTSFVPLTGPPCVANQFDSNIYEHGDTWIKSGRRKSYWINRLASDLAIRRAKRLFILSDYCRSYLARRFPAYGHKLVTIPCGLNPWPEPVTQEPVWAKALDRPYFVYVGTFSENKNQRRLLEAWKILQETLPQAPALVLIGPCPSDYQEVITRALADLRHPAQVILTGRIPDAEVSWAYTNALAGIQPSIAEGFGLPVIEAMSFGLPVACSNTTSLPETAGGAALLFDPFQPGEIAKSVKQLSQDAGLRQRMAQKGKARSEDFSWARSAELTRRVIAETLSELKLI